MLSYVLSGAVIFGFVTGLFGSISVRRAAHLEQKLGVLWRTLVMQGFALTMLGAAIFVSARELPRLSFAGGDDLAQLPAHLLELRSHTETGWLAIAALAFLLCMLLPVILHVLAEARAFVLTQRADLLGRDQAATWGEPSDPKPEAASTR